MAQLQYNKWKKVYRVLNDDGTSKTFKSESQARNYLGKLDKDIEDKKPTWEQKGFKDQFAMLSEEAQDQYMDKLSAKDFMKMNMYSGAQEVKRKEEEAKAHRVKVGEKYKEFQAEEVEDEKQIKQEEREASAKEQLKLLKESRAKSDKKREDYYKNPPPLAPEQEAQLEEQSGKLKERLEAFTDPSKIKEPQLRRPPKPEWKDGIKKVETKKRTSSSRKKIITPKTSQDPQKVILGGERFTADEAMKKLKRLKQKRGY